MGEKPDHGREEVPDPPAALPEDMQERAKEAGERRPEEGGGLRTMSRSMAAVAAGVLICGGIGLLIGVTLGAINPFVFGMIGIAVGFVASVPLMGR